jgi:hypothetical protein
LEQKFSSNPFSAGMCWLLTFQVWIFFGKKYVLIGTIDKEFEMSLICDSTRHAGTVAAHGQP